MNIYITQQLRIKSNWCVAVLHSAVDYTAGKVNILVDSAV